MGTSISTSSLLDQALGAETSSQRRSAFLQLLRSRDWRLVLAPHVLSRQAFYVRDEIYPDNVTFHRAAEVIAASEEQTQKCLEMAGSRFADELLLCLAQSMGPAFVEHALPHLRTAEGMRAVSLQSVLWVADRGWVALPGAGAAIRRHLRQTEIDRSNLLSWLADAGNLEGFISIMEEVPPLSVEEWNALGLSHVFSELLYERAMAIMPHHPGPLLYLLRLEPIPADVPPRMMSSARAEWVAAALEIATVHGLSNTTLVQLAELGVRLGGRCLSAATLWIGATKLSRQLLRRLNDELTEGSQGLDELVWIRRNAPSADRALERGRNDNTIDPMDAAALVRQIRGERAAEMVYEILDEPRATMYPLLLQLLCAVHTEAAQQVVNMCYSPRPEVAGRAREARQWRDILWPEEEAEEEEI